jgi:hypothetical protein
VKEARNRSPRSIAVAAGVLGLVALALEHALFALSAASIGIWVQAGSAFVAAAALFVGAYWLALGRSVAPIVFLGTVPLWLVHLAFTILDPSESPVFVIASTSVTATAGIVWFTRRPSASTRP